VRVRRQPLPEVVEQARHQPARHRQQVRVQLHLARGKDSGVRQNRNERKTNTNVPLRLEEQKNSEHP